MPRISNAVFQLSLALWVGGLFALTVIGAPVIFRTAGSRHLAGTIFGTLLRRFTWVELAAAGLACASFIAASRPPATLDWKRAALLAVMVLLLVSYAFLLHPAISQVRSHCGSFDVPPAGALETAARARFDSLHAWSERLVGLNLFLGAALIVLSAWRPR